MYIAKSLYSANGFAPFFVPDTSYLCMILLSPCLFLALCGLSTSAPSIVVHLRSGHGLSSQRLNDDINICTDCSHHHTFCRGWNRRPDRNLYDISTCPRVEGHDIQKVSSGALGIMMHMLMLVCKDGTPFAVPHYICSEYGHLDRCVRPPEHNFSAYRLLSSLHTFYIY